uniref:Ionotropic glutamate receptor C-terminal domain-containing protein n=1 Tax=Kalanchoe fedtschenkoi TaxID=63787 RepID=A0A7N0VIF7_KALFE
MFPKRIRVLRTLLLTIHVFLAPPVQGSGGSLNTDDLSKFHPVHVGVVLNMNSVVGSMADICLSMALDDFYDLQYDYKTRVVLHKRHADDVVSAASAVIDLLGTGEVVAIIGPQKSIEATFAIELGWKVQVPVITFSVTSPSISPAKNPYFIRTSQNDSYQVQALTELIQGFSWDEIVLIYEDTVYGNGIIPYLTDSLQKSNIKITYKCAFLKEANATQILEELNRMRGLKTQVFLVHMMTTSLGSQLFERANDVGLMTQGYAWIITDGLSNSLDDLVPIAIDSMDGVLGIRPYIPKSFEQANFKTRWKKQFYSLKPDSLLVSELNVFGLWAYDTVQALAKAVEDIWPLRSPLSQEGPRLLSKILNSKPTQGLSGDFHIVNGQLEPLALEIFNVIGNGERVIGYWTPKNGMSKSLNSPKRLAPSSVNNLRKIIWPGDSTVKPLGSGIPRTLKKLKIGVPRMIGFPDLGQLVLNQTTNKLMPIGYCVDVFKAVVEALPDPIKFEYELQYYPPANSYDRTSTYDELLYQVYNKTLDAVVGDTTIVADRWYVDFTLPYSDSGVSMVVPRRNLRPRNNSRDMFIFLKPFYWGLWVAVVVAFIATLLSIGFLRKMQHGENEERWRLVWIPMASIFANGTKPLNHPNLV